MVIKTNLNLNHTANTNINSKWITDPNVKSETINLLNINRLGLGGVLRHDDHKRKTSIKLTFTKPNPFAPEKGHVKRMKIQGTDWEKTFPICSSDKGPIARIYK